MRRGLMEMNMKIKDKLQTEDGTSTRFVPLDIVACILLRLPARSVARFRCVCKQWRSLTHDHRFIDEHHRLGSLQRRELVSTCWSDSQGLALRKFGPNDELERSYLRMKLKGSGGCVSNPLNGLVAAFGLPTWPDAGQYYQHCLVNPFTRDRLEIPGCRIEYGIGGLGLGFDASRGVYKLVSFQRYENWSCECMVLTVGDGGWRYVERPAHFAIGYSYSRPPVFVDRAIYWLATTFDTSWSWSILAFDVKDEKYRFIPAPKTQFVEDGTDCLREIEGKVCCVRSYDDRGATRTRVWRLEGQPGHEYWKLAYEFDVPDWQEETAHCEPWVVDIRGVKVILQSDDAIFSYDLRSKHLHKLFHGVEFPWERSVVITASLVSPRNLVEG